MPYKVDMIDDIKRWIRNHTTSDPAFSAATNTSTSTFSTESTGAFSFGVDCDTLWRGFVGGQYLTYASGTNKVVVSGTTGTPFAYASDIVDVKVLAYIYNDDGTAKLGGVVGKGAESGEAVAPTAKDVFEKLGHWDFVIVSTITYVASSVTACAFSADTVSRSDFPMYLGADS